MKKPLIFKIVFFAIITAAFIISSIKFGERSAWTISLFAAMFLNLIWIVYDKDYDRIFKSDKPQNVFATIFIALLTPALLVDIITHL